MDMVTIIALKELVSSGIHLYTCIAGNLLLGNYALVLSFSMEYINHNEASTLSIAMTMLTKGKLIGSNNTQVNPSWSARVNMERFNTDQQ